jgi:hypothetical protein
MAIDRDLAVGQFARRPGILAGHPDRVPPALLKVSVPMINVGGMPT